MPSGIKALCVGIGATTLLACATGTTRVAPTALDWDSADERWSIHVVTVDKDGADRVTRLWMAVPRGEPWQRLHALQCPSQPSLLR